MRHQLDFLAVPKQQPGRLGLEEGAPVGVGPARRRAQVCGGQDAADGAGADACRIVPPGI